jgi:hypothetical protein
MRPGRVEAKRPILLPEIIEAAFAGAADEVGEARRPMTT